MSQTVDKMQTVVVSGALIGLTGKREHPICTSPGTSIHGLMGYFRQFKGFEKHMIESAARGIRYAVFVGKQNIGEDDLGKPVGREVIRIVPVLAGSKRAGFLQTIIGVVLIVVGGIMQNPALIQFGAAIAIGGVLQMLSPQAKGLGSQDSPDNRPSYSFNGPVNTTAQGNPVPLLYGRMIVGSAVISAGIYTEDQM
ncbi:phage tail protein [Pseudomonas sp. S25]|uniref:Phage tail protein n=1 Tax=Pseudomonas maioricensis TaxID=1766623 RepID=A0ABS9ZKE0_9PSED|nr:tail assembly protein [Pseudomonas sp. S25]MCI8210786.1 phage tail protein [Pseudomonas sp. S25]